MVTEGLETSPAAGSRGSVHPGKSFKPVMPVCYIYCYFSNVLHSFLSLLCIMSGVGGTYRHLFMQKKSHMARDPPLWA